MESGAIRTRTAIDVPGMDRRIATRRREGQLSSIVAIGILPGDGGAPSRIVTPPNLLRVSVFFLRRHFMTDLLFSLLRLARALFRISNRSASDSAPKPPASPETPTGAAPEPAAA
ncbi:MAG TPA: hypothetical protein VFQ39_13225, partial [Longimicrobium sp.]|nr:hypothetical protein [Longimicrobium sp.]